MDGGVRMDIDDEIRAARQKFDEETRSRAQRDAANFQLAVALSDALSVKLKSHPMTKRFLWHSLWRAEPRAGSLYATVSFGGKSIKCRAPDNKYDFLPYEVGEG